MVERILGKAEVGSSILPGGTIGTQDLHGIWVPTTPPDIYLNRRKLAERDANCTGIACKIRAVVFRFDMGGIRSEVAPRRHGEPDRKRSWLPALHFPSIALISALRSASQVVSARSCSIEKSARSCVVLTLRGSGERHG